ncbi:MAG: SAM-dependent methyltransferase [archaeon]
MKPVSRGYDKLKFAVEKFGIDIKEKVCADLGSSTGGFVQVLLEKGALKVYSVDNGRNRLHFMLKDDKRVEVIDEVNAMYVTLPEKVDIITIDVGWTPQKKIIPNAIKNLKNDGKIISLVKPQYEAYPEWLDKGTLKEENLGNVIDKVKKDLDGEATVLGIAKSPIKGEKGKNVEFFVLLEKN